MLVSLMKASLFNIPVQQDRPFLIYFEPHHEREATCKVFINGNGNGIYIPHFLYAYSNAVYITTVQG